MHWQLLLTTIILAAKGCSSLFRARVPLIKKPSFSTRFRPTSTTTITMSVIDGTVSPVVWAVLRSHMLSHWIRALFCAAGTAISATIREELKASVDEMKATYGVTPGLAVILVGDRRDSATYVRSKKKACAEIGITSFGYDYPATVTQEELLAKIDELNADPAVNGILVQLPLPPHLDEATVLHRILQDKDVDGLHPLNVAQVSTNHVVTPFVCTAPVPVLVPAPGGPLPCPPSTAQLTSNLRSPHAAAGQHEDARPRAHGVVVRLHRVPRVVHAARVHRAARPQRRGHRGQGRRGTCVFACWAWACSSRRLFTRPPFPSRPVPSLLVFAGAGAVQHRGHPRGAPADAAERHRDHRALADQGHRGGGEACRHRGRGGGPGRVCQGQLVEGTVH